MKPFRDMLGRDIAVGDLIVVGRRSGNYSKLTVYEVIEVNEREDRWGSDTLPYPKVKIVASSYYGGEAGKTTYLQSLGAILRIDRESLSGM